jgi:glycosyltransferase involved in cell wall biosynthesis
VTDDRHYYHCYFDGEHQVKRYPRWLRGFGPWRRLIARRLRALGIPVEDCFLFLALQDWSLDLRAAWVIARRGLRLYQAEFPAYARVCIRMQSLFGGSAVLVEHNIEYERLFAQLEPDQLPAAAFVQQVEIGLCHQVDAVVTVSARDRDTLLGAGIPGHKLITIPHGVDVNTFDNTEPSRDLLSRYGVDPDRPVMVYHGTFRYRPNVEAVQMLVDEVLPRLRAQGIDAVVLAVGAYPPGGFDGCDVIFTGSVTSVAAYIRSADVAVMPLQQGAGTRMKVMDYFAAGIPVVSTSKGIEGLDLEDGRELLVRDDWDSFADAVMTVINEREALDALVSAGRKYVQQLDWSDIARRYLKLYAEIRAV